MTAPPSAIGPREGRSQKSSAGSTTRSATTAVTTVALTRRPIIVVDTKSLVTKEPNPASRIIDVITIALPVRRVVNSTACSSESNRGRSIRKRAR